MCTTEKELEILRERCMEYRALLELIYSMLHDPKGPPTDEAIEKFLAKLEDFGVGEKDTRPAHKRVYV